MIFHKKNIIIICCALSLSAPNIIVADSAQKEAFDMGIKSAIKVMKYERKQTFKPIVTGYCIEVKPVNVENTDDFSAIKLESLSLYMELNPSFIGIMDGNGEMQKKLCFAMTDKSKLHAENLLKNIKKKYPKIESFYPSVLRISNPLAYHRLVPGIGELYEDKSSVIDGLVKESHKTRREQKELIKQKNKKIKELEEKLKKINSFFKSEISPDKQQSLMPTTDSKKADKKVEKKKELKKEVGKEGSLKERKDNKVEIPKSEYDNTFKYSKKMTKKEVKYPVIKMKDTDNRYVDKEKGVIVKVVDAKNPKILKLETKK